MATVTPHAPDKPAAEPVPPLHNGDRLTRQEFHRRYEAMPNLYKAELIDGVVHIPSPRCVRLSSRGRADLVCWLGTYHAYTPGTEAGLNPTVLLGPRSEPQPDAPLMVIGECGGQTRISEDGFIEGAPELMADAHDVALDAKLKAYSRAGVKEYIVSRIEPSAIEWYVLRGDRFDRLQPNSDGWFKSEAFPGLWLDGPALLAGNLRRVFEIAQIGLKTPEHAAFVQQLEQRRQKQP